jgi:hemoglobin-like flavoprotein
VTRLSDRPPIALDVQGVRASFGRCLKEEDFIPSFYATLWGRDPEIRRRFRGADMDRQHQVMRDAITALIMFAGGSQIARMALDRLAKSHAPSGHDVSAHQFELFGDTLVSCVAERDPQWSEELAQQWRTALAPGLSLLASHGAG